MKRRGLLPLLLLSGCTTPPQSPMTVAGPDERPNCYQLPPAQWGACLERARQIGFNVYECERRALYGRQQD
jgi:hypothetical protein